MKPRLPPGQHLIRNKDKFPVLQKGEIPHIKRDSYELKITGEVKNPIKLSLNDLKRLLDSETIVDIHCVTSWSKFDTEWKGISFKKLFNIVKPKESARFIEFRCADGGFTTTIPISKLLEDNCLLALEYEGKPLTDEHGGPLRAIIPHLYFYKSAKWIIEINFLKEDRLRYWERAGYSNKADPWKEQRYRQDNERE
ncbi:MAG: molybdopterin-dependent oxidoreductase [Promethearchaeia archaeon]